MRIVHPRELLTAETHVTDLILDWIGDHVLASKIMAYLALILPLLVLPMNDTVKLTLAVISGSWIQWWALPILQRSQNKAEAMREAKADADHQALTHIASQLEKLVEKAG